MKLIIGIEGLALTPDDRTRLQHPAVAGVILFKRNYHNHEQLKTLTQHIRQIRNNLFISIDHEGGRVQRLRKGFTALPSGKQLLARYRENPSDGLALAEISGLVMALELQDHGIDLSYAPVLDLDYGISNVIGDRSFGNLTQDVIALAGASIRGMHRGGMACVGKHFPGHGGVSADTHGEIAIDNRAFSYLWNADILPFRQLIQEGLDAIMPAHVIYSQVTHVPAGFSHYWLQDILRRQMGFEGVIITDDLDMSGSNAVGDLATKLSTAAQAGCDLSLICNHFDAMNEALSLSETFMHAPAKSYNKLYGRFINQIPHELKEQLPHYRTKLHRLTRTFS